MINAGHNSVLEHGTVYLSFSLSHDVMDDTYERMCQLRNKYILNKYSVVHNNIGEYTNTDQIYVTTNLRVLHENAWMDDLKYFCNPTEYHERRISVSFTCDRVTGESFLRHRSIDEDSPTIEGEVTREMESDINSFARESTRYCNYTTDKFGKEFTVIVPPEFYNKDTNEEIKAWGEEDNEVFANMCNTIANYNDDKFTIFDVWYFGNIATQWSYNKLIEMGWKAQQARRVIPLDIKSPLVMTAFICDWEHFFYLRSSEGAHPQAIELAVPLQEEFKTRGYIK